MPAWVSILSLELSRPTLQAGNVFALLFLVGVVVVVYSCSFVVLIPSLIDVDVVACARVCARVCARRGSRWLVGWR